MTWQPIETAPKDGTEVLGYWFGNDVPIISVILWRGHRYPDNPWRNALSDSATRGWGQCHLPDGKLTWRQGPTHWMPLPEPPEAPHD
jgi:hypothetical protein